MAARTGVNSQMAAALLYEPAMYAQLLSGLH